MRSNTAYTLAFGLWCRRKIKSLIIHRRHWLNHCVGCHYFTRISVRIFCRRKKRIFSAFFEGAGKMEKVSQMFYVYFVIFFKSKIDLGFSFNFFKKFKYCFYNYIFIFFMFFGKELHLLNFPPSTLAPLSLS